LPISNGASPIASALGIRLGATPREHIHPTIQLQNDPIKQDISTLLGLGHFYFALTWEVLREVLRLKIAKGCKCGKSRDRRKATPLEPPLFKLK